MVDELFKPEREKINDLFNKDKDYNVCIIECKKLLKNIKDNLIDSDYNLWYLNKAIGFSYYKIMDNKKDNGEDYSFEKGEAIKYLEVSKMFADDDNFIEVSDTVWILSNLYFLIEAYDEAIGEYEEIIPILCKSIRNDGTKEDDTLKFHLAIYRYNNINSHRKKNIFNNEINEIEIKKSIKLLNQIKTFSVGDYYYNKCYEALSEIYTEEYKLTSIAEYYNKAINTIKKIKDHDLHTKLSQSLLGISK